jgi:hypothetical protein
VVLTEPVVATAPSSSALYGGTGTVHALYRGKEATATLTVKVHLVDYGAGLNATSPGVVALGRQGLAGDPGGGLLYPYDKTVWPLGLTSPLLMTNAPQAGDVCRLHYAEKNYSFDGYSERLLQRPGGHVYRRPVWGGESLTNTDVVPVESVNTHD